jgi:hypothetical protein
MEGKQWWIYDLMEERVEVIFNLQSSSFLSSISKKIRRVTIIVEMVGGA